MSWKATRGIWCHDDKYSNLIIPPYTLSTHPCLHHSRQARWCVWSCRWGNHWRTILWLRWWSGQLPYPHRYWGKTWRKGQKQSEVNKVNKEVNPLSMNTGRWSCETLCSSDTGGQHLCFKNSWQLLMIYKTFWATFWNRLGSFRCWFSFTTDPFEFV